MSSCSWVKHRFSRHRKAPAPAARVEKSRKAPAQPVVIQPTAAQQEAALNLLKETEKVEVEPPVSAPEAEEMPVVLRQPYAPAAEEPVQDAPPTLRPDAAAQRGFRSPALPKLLPMDINGKLRSSSTY